MFNVVQSIAQSIEQVKLTFKINCVCDKSWQLTHAAAAPRQQRRSKQRSQLRRNASFLHPIETHNYKSYTFDI